MAARKSRSSSSGSSTRFALRADSGLFMGNVFPLMSSRTVIGRSVEVEVPVDDTKVSRSHAAVDFRSGHPVVVDLGSTNGTYVNGVRVENLLRVTVGDKIRVGSSVFVLELFDEAKQKLNKTWRAPTQAIMRKSLENAVAQGTSEKTSQPKVAEDSTGVRWRWLLDSKQWRKKGRHIQPWLLSALCLVLLGVALSI